MESPAEKSFEGALKRLEEIVRALEGNTPSLEDSLALYEEGRALIGFCLEKLESAEQKLKVLLPPEEL
ncbi:MAG: exodeoxyribonuclease VII small subunit [Candidatus Zixiibacteriota bacterium]|nr:MAG: exodeoxyribonuclease VII small subunit [candidate division Zixibacteria bacterium]